MTTPNLAIIAQLAECIGRHVINIQRDGLPNSLAHLEKIDEDAKTIHAISSDGEWSMPLHGL